MKALILAGGFGTRLKDVVKDVPKPMALVAGKPFLEYQLRYLKEQNVKEVILAVHHMSSKIKSYFAGGLRLGIDIIYSEEDSPLGTGGAIKKAQRYLDDTFLVLNGDSYSKINLEDFLNFHNAKKSNFTISLTKSDNAINYGGVTLEGNKVNSFVEKGIGGHSLINTGIYLFEPKIFDYIPADKPISLEKEVFPRLVAENSLFGYVYQDYFIDIGRPETYKQFKHDVLDSLSLRGDEKLINAMKKMKSNGINLILVVDDDKKLKGVLTDQIINSYLLKEKSIDAPIHEVMVNDPITVNTKDDNSKISELLISGINQLPVLDDDRRVVDVEFRVEKIKTETFPILRGKAPLRISFAGGGTDLPYFFEQNGGVVINATINQYCHATIVKRADSKILINSDLCDDLFFDVRNIECDGKFNLVKAVTNILKPDFGFELYLRNDVPPGRGLGSSATLAVLIAKLISNLQSHEYDDYKLADIAYTAERDELKIKGGWQDQYAAVTGGFNFMEFDADKRIIYPLRLKEDTISELNERLLLCYVGSSHYSSDVHENQEKSFIAKKEDMVPKLIELKKIAIDIKDSLLVGELDKIGDLLHKSWENKKRLDSVISNIEIDRLYNIGLKNGAYGGKLLGAGAGGYLLFMHSPYKRNQLSRVLESEGGSILNFNFEKKGVKVWQVRD